MTDPHRPPAGPPALRPPGPPPPVPAGSSAPLPRAPLWKRLTRTRRGAAGIGVLAAALLLWPFSGLSWIPWLAGLAVLVLLALLRLDRVLHGWTWHVAGLVVVAGLMVSTSPWAWALAASLGVLLAGLLRLPAWRLAAVGAVLCLVSGAAFGFASYQAREEARAENARAGDPLRQVIGEAEPSVILPIMIQAVADDDADPICRLLTAEATTQLLAATATPDCSSAVTALHLRATAGDDGADADAPVPAGGELRVDACDSAWVATAGEALGQVRIVRTASELERYAVAGFAPC
jgi:hypothetical protein